MSIHQDTLAFLHVTFLVGLGRHGRGTGDEEAKSFWFWRRISMSVRSFRRVLKKQRKQKAGTSV